METGHWQEAALHGGGNLISLFVANLSGIHYQKLATGLCQRCFVPKDTMGRVFGFVRITDGLQAERTIGGLNGTLLKGRRLQVNLAHFRRDKKVLYQNQTDAVAEAS